MSFSLDRKSLKSVIAGLFLLATLSTEAQKPTVIAHRGNHQHAPENTLRAFRDAIAAGVDFVEVDLRTTRDSVLLVMHDETVDRTTNGNGRVSQMNWKELQNLTVTDKNHSENGTEKIPAFVDVLKLCKGKMKIYLDFKAASVEPTWKQIKSFGMENDVVVYVNSMDQYEQWRAHAPRLPIICSLPRYTSNVAESFLNQTPAEILDGRLNDYTTDLISLIHQKGVKVWIDVQHPREDSITWSQALSLPCDGLQTDHPEELINYLKQRGLR